MTWWEQLTHPEGNVVAATIVLVGVVLTGAITLLVSWRNRKHERGKENRDRLFTPRAEAYVEAQSFLVRDQAWARSAARPKRSREAEAEMVNLRSRIIIYGTMQAEGLFNQTVEANLEYATTKADFEMSEMYKRIAEFGMQASADVQDHRFKMGEWVDPPPKKKIVSAQKERASG